MTLIRVAWWIVFVAAVFSLASSVERQAPIRKAILDTNKDRYLEETKCICDVQSDSFHSPIVSSYSIDSSLLKKFEAIAQSMASAVTAVDGDLSPQEEIRLLTHMLYQDTHRIAGCWLGYTPDSYGTAFNRSYNMAQSVKLVSYKDCADIGACNYTDEHNQENITVRFIEQLARNATLHHPYIYAKGCCNPVSHGDYLGSIERAWTRNYFDPDPTFDFFTLPLKNYLYGNTTWLDAGRWSNPYLDPVAGAIVSFGVPFVTRTPLLGSVDPFIFRDTGHEHTGFMKSFEGFYVLGVAGVDLHLDEIKLDCPDGFYSTYPTCSKCRLGEYRTVETSSARCDRCAAGRYADKNGSSECSRCPIGQYAEEPGKTACLQCPDGMTTGGRGSISVQDCVCPQRTFLGATSHHCEPCPVGMTCPLNSVDPSFGDLTRTPNLLPGYSSSLDLPLDIYLCVSEKLCPGGLPGTCGGGHIGLACQRCEAGHYESIDGQCKTCDTANFGPLVAFLVVVLTGAVISHVVVNYPFVKRRRGSVASLLLVGLAVTALLSFNIYDNLNAVWVSPISELLSISRVLAFDINVLKFSCVVGSNDLMPRYAFKLGAIPGAFLVVCLVSFLMQFTNWTRDFAFFSIPDLMNSAGLFLSVLFITVSLFSFEGFLCVRNPSGLDSLLNEKSVVCWHSADHYSLVVANSVAILVYPVNILVITSFCTWKYYALADRFGTKFTYCMRFLINRWNPDQYYFGAIFMFRNFALTIAPITQPNNFDIQVTLLQLIFLSWLVVQLTWRPWRFDILNKFDAMTTAMQIVVLNSFGLLGGKVAADSLSAEAAGFIGFGAFLSVILLTLGASVISLVHKFWRLKEYGLFLSHYKGVDALYARQIKLMLATFTTRQVFLDVDNLASLDELVFLVRSSIDNLVVMLSSETLSRFWCAVEIICATKNAVPILLTNTHPMDYLLSSILDKVPSMWGPGQIMDFNKVGIDAIPDTEMAYRFVSTLPIIKMLMSSSEDAQMDAVSRIVLVAKGCRTGKRTYHIESHQVCYIVYDTNSFVQASCARIMCMLMKMNRWNCWILCDEFTTTEVGTSITLVLISHNLSLDAIAIGHLCYSSQNRVPFTTIVSQEDFQSSKPSNEYMKQLQEGTAFNMEQLAVLGRIAPLASAQFIADAVMELYACLAARFNPQDSEHMLLVEMSTIVKRVEQHLPKLTRKPSGTSTQTTNSPRRSYSAIDVPKRDSTSECVFATNDTALSRCSFSGLNLPPIVDAEPLRVNNGSFDV